MRHAGKARAESRARRARPIRGGGLGLQTSRSLVATTLKEPRGRAPSRACGQGPPAVGVAAIKTMATALALRAGPQVRRPLHKA